MCEDLQRPPALFLYKGILLYVPARGSLLHGHVTAISKSVAEDWKPSGNRYNGTYGLQVWKVAQLVEQETIPSPKFDSWLSNLSRKNYEPADCGKHFQHIRHLAAVGCLSLCGEGDAVRCTWLISSDCGFDSYSPYFPKQTK